ncbi:MAG TPA: M23 family peptidase, partial [Myxococcaceae bacterium]|nr:M23 family peptidase [Myxococcaceae bacterium]
MAGLQPTLLTALTLAAALLSAPALGSAPVLEIQPGTARPGDVVLIRIRGVASAPSGKLGARQLAFFPGPGGYWALAALEMEQAPGEVAVSVSEPSTGAAEEIAGTVTVVEPNSNRRELTVANRFIHPSAAARRWLAEDQAAFERAYDRAVDPPLFTDNFRWPRQSAITARFGDLRLLNGAKDSQHYGVDLDGRSGAPVFSANDGEVVLVRRCFASGN